ALYYCLTPSKVDKDEKLDLELGQLLREDLQSLRRICEQACIKPLRWLMWKGKYFDLTLFAVFSNIAFAGMCNENDQNSYYLHVLNRRSTDTDVFNTLRVFSLGVELFGRSWKGKIVRFVCCNKNVVHALNSLQYYDQNVMAILKKISNKATIYGFQFFAQFNNLERSYLYNYPVKDCHQDSAYLGMMDHLASTLIENDYLKKIGNRVVSFHSSMVE
ncbi:hypothetical protein RFI_25873, partial [Reticulomyxa filosa]